MKKNSNNILYMKLKGKILHNLLNNDLQINWDEVEKIEHFQALKNGGYHNLYHQEGNAFEHTKRVCEACKSLPEWETLSDIDKYILIVACLFHDIGKSKCHKQKTDGNWSAYGHDLESERMFRYMFWDYKFRHDFNGIPVCHDYDLYDLEIRETICSLIRYHMEAKYATEKEGKYLDQQLIKISQNTRWDLLYLLSKCDKLGSICVDLKDCLQKLEEIRCRCVILKCFNKPFKEKISYYSEDEYMIFDYLNNKHAVDYLLSGNSRLPKFTCFMMCGLPGSGKDFYIDEHFKDLNLPIVSRDLIRVEFGFCRGNEKYKGTRQQEETVTKREREIIREYCWNKRSFIHNNINITKKYRDEVIKTVANYGGRVEIIYIETSKEKSIERRKGQIQKERLIKMQKEMSLPYPSECHRLIYNKN